MKKRKYNLKAFERVAANLLPNLSEGCNRYFICRALDKNPGERKLFQKLYVDGLLVSNFYSALVKIKSQDGESTKNEEKMEQETYNIRILALCFTHEIARQINNRKMGDFR